MTDLRTGAGNKQDELGASVGLRKRKKKKAHDDETVSKGHRSQVKELPKANTGTISTPK